MKHNKIYRAYLLSLILYIFTSCERFVDVGAPTDMLVTESVFRNNETALSAMSGIYINMMSSQTFRLPFTIAELTGMYGDELIYHGSAVSELNTYRNQLVSKDAQTNPIWTSAYKFIYQANSIIHGLEKSNNVTDAVKRQLMGESLFLRAFWHYYLLNLYGQIPLITSIDYTVNSTMARQNVAKVYEALVNDLIQAKNLLADKYVSGNAIDESNDRLRPNKAAASALLAKVYMLGEEWAKAVTESSIVIENTAYKLEEPAFAFKAHSKEAILQLALPSPAVANTYEALYFTLKSAPASAGQSAISLRKQLVSEFSDSDLRKIDWIGVFRDESTVPIREYFYPAKYKTITTEVDEHSILLRLSDIYLIRAEALARQNKISQAIDDIDKVRLRADLSSVDDNNLNITQNELLDSIFLERKRELFCEWGNRWIDMKRTGTASEIMNNVTVEKGGSWSDNWLVWPIPLIDINNNTKLIQNEGYE